MRLPLPVPGTAASATATHTCFVYGTLMAPEVLQTLLGRVPTIDPRPAFLPEGYARHPVKGRVFPAVVPVPTTTKGSSSSSSSNNNDYRVRGLLLSGIDSDEMDRLDWFEADEYERRTLAVELRGNDDGNGDGNGNDNDNGNGNGNGNGNEEHERTAEAVDAQVYVWCAGDHFLEIDQSWNFDDFCTHKLDWYLGSTVRPCREDYDRQHNDKNDNHQE